MRIFNIVSVVKYSGNCYLVWVVFMVSLKFSSNCNKNVIIHTLLTLLIRFKQSIFAGEKRKEKESLLSIRLSLYNRKCHVTSTCTKKSSIFPIHVQVRVYDHKATKVGELVHAVVIGTMREKGIYASKNVRERGFFFLHY